MTTIDCRQKRASESVPNGSGWSVGTPRSVSHRAPRVLGTLLLIGLLVTTGCRDASGPTGTEAADPNAAGNPGSDDSALNPTAVAPFASLDSDTNQALDAARDEAIALAQQGDYLAAEERILRVVQDLEQSAGVGSAPWAAAQFHLATIYLVADRTADAVDAMRKACQIQVVDPKGPAQRDRLTYLMNLGEALIQIDEFEEAERVFRDGLEQRADFYGTDHPGYAFGLEPLAKLLTLRGKHDDAIRLADEALANFRTNQHDREHSALLTRAAAYAAAGKSEDAFPARFNLTDEQVAKLTRLAIFEESLSRPDWSFPLLVQLAPLVEQHIADDNLDRLNFWITFSNVARLVGKPAERLEAMENVVAICRDTGRHENEFDALLGLAWARDDAGQTEAAHETYAEALKLAERFKQDEAIAEAHRSWGLSLSESGQPDAARPHLEQAVSICRRAGDSAKLARAEITLGIFLQHQQEFEPAKQLLQAGCARLDPIHPDAICGASHLQAVEKGEDCGCGDTARVLAENLRKRVLEQLPKDLVKDVQFDFSGGHEPQVRFDTHRSPSQAESQLMARTANEAMAELRREIRKSSGISR